MNKQQAICLKLAQWLGKPLIVSTHSGIVKFWNGAEYGHVEFNPFAPTTDGRAQFAECVIKAVTAGMDIDLSAIPPAVRVWAPMSVDTSFVVEHNNTAESIVAATLEASFYAIGGSPSDLEEQLP